MGRLRGSLAAWAALGLVIGSGCAREPLDVREVRLAAERYMAALARKDFDEIRNRATCLVPVQSIQGGNVLRIEAPRHISVAKLDSMVVASGWQQQRADSLWIRSEGGDRDELFQTSRRAGRLHITYRNASRAVAASRPDSLAGSGAQVETRAVRMRVRYAGELVGPHPVDREVILRLLKIPSGKWIAFSFYTVEDDPRPDGV